MNLSEFVSRYFPEAKKNGVGYKARCPAHKDKTPSLVVSAGQKGLVVHCHTGCTPEKILASLGLTFRDLFYDATPPKPAPRLRSWEIKNRRGEVVATHFRKDTADGKLYWWETHGKQGLQGRKAKDLPLYGEEFLSGFNASQWVFLCEGEKDTDALRELSVQALGTVTGADSLPSQQVFEGLRGKRVALWPDNDNKGREHVRRCASMLKDVAAELRILEVPGLPPGGGAFDWVSAQKQAGISEKEPLLSALSQLVTPQTKEKKEVVREKERVPPPDGGKEALLSRLSLGEKGKVLSTLDNALVILVRDPRWEGVLGKNELSQQVVFLRPPPWDEEAAPRWPVAAGTPWKDADSVRLAAWMSRHWGLKLSPNAACDIAALAAEKQSFHPIRDQLESLTWDGVERLSTWLCRYLGAADTPYVRAVGKKWMISAVARIEKPGAKADCLLVLEGGQGLGKSQALEVLAGMDFFSDQLGGDLGSREAAITLQGKWILEIAEFDKLERQEAAVVKAFISRRTDRYRSPYGRSAQDYPRQCVFCGTTNKTDYLRDETGARRFWPVQVGEVDLETLRRDRAQLWAEARARFLAGERWWLEGKEADLQKEETHDRYQGDAWSEPITQWLLGQKKTHTTVPELLREVLALPESKWDQSAQNRVARVLIQMGWQRVRVSTPTGRLWRYQAPLPAEVRPSPTTAHPTEGGRDLSQSPPTGTATGTAFQLDVERSVPVVPVVPVRFVRSEESEEKARGEGAVQVSRKETGTTGTTGTRRMESGFAKGGDWDKDRDRDWDSN
jgi:predicted P-loop ATPase